MKLVFAHVETSGLDPDTCEILELSYQTWEDGKRSVVSNDKFRAVGNLTAPAFVEAAKLNGYDDEQRINCATLRAGFLIRFFESLTAADGALIACNPTFVHAFITSTAKRLGVPVPRIRCYDVSSLAMPLLLADKVKGTALHALVEGVCPDKPAPKSSSDKVERTADVFEQCIVRYFAALVPPAGAK